MTSTLEQLHPPVRDSGPSSPASEVAEATGEEAHLFSLVDLPRELGRVVGSQPGPTLVCLGGLHGNEPAGVLAIRRVIRALERQETPIRGEMVGLVGNRQALACGRRFVDHDLNRAWHADRLARLLKRPGPEEAEDREQLELDAVLQRLLDEACGRVFLLDLHTTSGPGSAFAILDDTLPNREVALDFPVPLVLGLEEELAGTLASYLTGLGVTVLGFEAGQHDDPISVDRAEAAIWLALDSSGVLDDRARDRSKQAWQTLALQATSSVRIVEVRHRHPVEPGRDFRMAPGFSSFQPVVEGQLLAHASSGPVMAPSGGLLLMPLYQEQGEDGFFLVREVRPIWLRVSATLRSWDLERFLHWLPGVSRDPDRPDTLIVDRRYVRWFALRLFHLLGYRREGKDGRILVMTRRRD